MSLHEPDIPTPNTYARQFLDRLARRARDTGRPAFSFAEVCSQASIPRDLREKLLLSLLREKYITRVGDQVSITPTGKTVATTLSI
jgi:hypothetical protein